jgi:hypothetical protein
MGNRIQAGAEANVVDFKKAEPSSRTTRSKPSGKTMTVSDSHDPIPINTKRTDEPSRLMKPRPSSKIDAFIESHPLVALGSLLLVTYLISDNTKGRFVRQDESRGSVDA